MSVPPESRPAVPAADASSTAIPMTSQPTGGPGVTAASAPSRPREVGGPGGPEPTRYGDWERAGRCIDF
ncbi:MAG TPA: DUF1674 domain-containing protein [Steroidobacteraceae bacterium]|nr:DUF1674 domain-containing protein [Steroidobacteraceae bacterium]